MAKTILTKKDAAKAVALQDRLVNDYLPYFTALDKSELIFVAENKGIVAVTTVKIKRAISLIARVFLGTGVTPSTPQELVNLNKILDEINVAYADISNRALEYAGLKEALNQATELTAISPDELSLAVQLSRKERKKFEQRGAKRGGVEGVIGSILKGIGLKTPGQLIGAGIGTQLAAPLLGPYATPSILFGGYQALRLGSWLGKKGLEGLGWGAKKLYRSGRLPKQMGKGDKRAPRETAAPNIPVSIPEPVRETAAQPRDFLGQFLPKSGTRKKRTKRELMYEAAPINYFFDKQANKAKWTKDLLKAVKQIGRFTGGAKGTGILGDVLAGAVGGKVAAGGAGALAAKALGVAKVATGVGALVALQTIDPVGPGGKTYKSNVLFSEFTGIGKKEHRDAWLAPPSKADFINLIPEQKPFWRYLGMGPSGGKRTLLGDIKRWARGPQIIGSPEKDQQGFAISSIESLERNLQRPDPLENLNRMGLDAMTGADRKFDEMIKEQKKTNEILEKQTRPPVVEQPSGLDDKNTSRELNDFFGMQDRQW